MPNDAVTVAYVHPNEVSHSWQESLMAMLGHDLGSECRVARGGWLSIRCYGADGISAARNNAVEQFLAEKDSDWLLWIDTDMGFAPDTVDRLFEVADPVKRPIVGALCFAQKQTVADGMAGWRTAMVPTLYDWTTVGEETGFLSRRDYPINSVVRCAGTGSACILIHRSVFQRLYESHGPTWYHRVPNPTAGGKLIGEDLSFCLRAGAVGFPVHVHTGVRTTHHKPVWLAESDYWQQIVAKPATDETAVIVPVMRRPQNAAPFMASLRASTGLATAYAVAEADDTETIAAWTDAGAGILLANGSTFAEKVNEGYRSTSEPWMLLVGDDVRFHPGWLDHAQAVAKDQYHVIGTNDLANPRVTAGEHATHLLVRRSYVDEVGAGWDGPKVIAHEGYRHWYVDDEIVTAARQRDAWAMAFGSVIEHRHPLWGTAESDEVYELGQSHAKEDLATFRRRFSEHAEVESAQ